MQAQAKRTLSLDDYAKMESVSNPQISPDGERIIFTRGWINLKEDKRESQLYRVQVMDGTMVGTLSSYHEPGDIVRYTPNGTVKRLTHVNADVLDQIELGEVEEVRYTSTDGTEIQGWLVKPPNFDPDKKYPLILRIHGGPHSMYRVSFNFNFQMHAADGALVLYTNPRGSTGVNDLRTPISQTEEYYQALKVQKVPSVMLRFNDEYHGTGSNPSNYLRTMAYLRSWFEQWPKTQP